MATKAAGIRGNLGCAVVDRRPLRQSRLKSVQARRKRAKWECTASRFRRQKEIPIEDKALAEPNEGSMLACANKKPCHAWVIIIAALALALLFLVPSTQAQTDPGVRGGAAGAGGSLPGLTVQESKFFRNGQSRFLEVDSV